MKTVFRFFRTLHRAAALDSLRNVLAVIGGSTTVANFSVMRVWMLAPCAALLFAIWLADYYRHFEGESAEESCIRELSAIPKR